MEHMPNKLRELRYRKVLKQSEVAELIGLKGTARISLWETGEAMPSVENLFKLANLFEVAVEEIYPILTTTHLSHLNF